MTAPGTADEPFAWEGSCLNCGGRAHQNRRYPRALCGHCHDRTTDLEGRPVRLGNTSASGGFQAWHRDDDSPCEQVTDDGRVLVDGREYGAQEAHMGGTVVIARDR